MKDQPVSPAIRFSTLDLEVAAVPQLQLQPSSKPPRQFLTYKESCEVVTPSAMISVDALVTALEQTLRIAKDSPHWSVQERKGAVALVIHLNEHFELGMGSAAPQGLTPAG